MRDEREGRRRGEMEGRKEKRGKREGEQAAGRQRMRKAGTNRGREGCLYHCTEQSHNTKCHILSCNAHYDRIENKPHTKHMTQFYSKAQRSVARRL